MRSQTRDKTLYPFLNFPAGQCFIKGKVWCDTTATCRCDTNKTKFTGVRVLNIMYVTLHDKRMEFKKKNISNVRQKKLSNVNKKES